MKKYTYSNSRWVLLGLIAPILMFFFAMNSVYAYFTATAQSQKSSVSTGSIKLEFTEDISTTQNAIAVVEGTAIYPGQTFNFSGTVKNTGNSSLYAILVWNVVVVNEDDSETILYTEYYTPTGAKLTKNDDDSYSGAVTMAQNATQTFNLEYSFGFYDNSLNEHQGKEVKFVFNARGIQTVHITQDEATQRLVELTI